MSPVIATPGQMITTLFFSLSLPSPSSNRYILEHIHDGFPEEPRIVGFIARHHLHADAEVAVAAEEVDGSSHSYLRHHLTHQEAEEGRR